MADVSFSSSHGLFLGEEATWNNLAERKLCSTENLEVHLVSELLWAHAGTDTDAPSYE